MKVDRSTFADTLILRAIPQFITLKQAQELYGMSRTTLYRLRHERKIFHYLLGDKTYIKVAELDDLIERGKK